MSKESTLNFGLLGKSAADIHRMLALWQAKSFEWFKRFKESREPVDRRLTQFQR